MTRTIRTRELKPCCCCADAQMSRIAKHRARARPHALIATKPLGRWYSCQEKLQNSLMRRVSPNLLALFFFLFFALLYEFDDARGTILHAPIRPVWCSRVNVARASRTMSAQMTVCSAPACFFFFFRVSASCGLEICAIECGFIAVIVARV